MSKVYRISDESYRPHQYRDGSYRLYPRHARPPRHLAAKTRRVFSLEEVVQLLATLEWCLRMSVGGRGRSPVGIIPEDIAVAHV